MAIEKKSDCIQSLGLKHLSHALLLILKTLHLLMEKRMWSTCNIYMKMDQKLVLKRKLIWTKHFFSEYYAFVWLYFCRLWFYYSIYHRWYKYFWMLRFAAFTVRNKIPSLSIPNISSLSLSHKNLFAKAYFIVFLPLYMCVNQQSKYVYERCERKSLSTLISFIPCIYIHMQYVFISLLVLSSLKHRIYFYSIFCTQHKNWYQIFFVEIKIIIKKNKKKQNTHTNCVGLEWKCANISS